MRARATAAPVRTRSAKGQAWIPDHKNRPASELLADWREAERGQEEARSEADAAGRAVATADAAKAAAALSEAAVTEAAAAVERAREASGLAQEAASHASAAAQLIHSEAKQEEQRSAEGVRDADAEQQRAADAFREAQRQGFPKDPA